MRIGDVRVGEGQPLALISGLNVIESQDAAIETALAVQGVAERHDMPVVFKASSAAGEMGPVFGSEDVSAALPAVVEMGEADISPVAPATPGQ